MSPQKAYLATKDTIYAGQWASKLDVHQKVDTDEGTKAPRCLKKTRVFLNLWSAEPMVCMRVAFHEHDRSHAKDENDKDNSDGYK